MTDWERLLAMQFDMNFWLEQEHCSCEGTCECEEDR